MSTSDTTLEHILALAQKLRPADQARLVAQIATTIQRTLDESNIPLSSSSRTPLRGMLADLRPTPSAEDIDSMQHEMWATFPGEDE